MKLRKKTRGEDDCFLKMRELLKSSTEGLEQCFNIMKREKRKRLTDKFSAIQFD